MVIDREREQIELLLAKDELGEEEFNKRYRIVFGSKCLDFVDSIVINLPESCYANCDYCIDNYLRQNQISTEGFLEICEKVFQEFPKAKKVAITGGSLKPNAFNKLVMLIKTYFPNCYINWNTNGIGIDEQYLPGISLINHVNLHRNSIDDNINKQIFRTGKEIISIEQAKLLLGKKLCLRITVDEYFDIDAYAKLGIPLYLNRLLPGTEKTDEVFQDVIKKLNMTDNVDNRRRNVYLTANYQETPVRICMGDSLATHKPNRLPTFLNVVIIHRSGIVCGSWFEDDKVIYNPYEKQDNIGHGHTYVLTNIDKDRK